MTHSMTPLDSVEIQREGSTSHLPTTRLPLCCNSVLQYFLQKAQPSPQTKSHFASKIAGSFSQMTPPAGMGDLPYLSVWPML